MSAWSTKSMPASRAASRSARTSSSVLSAMRMRPSTTLGATISVPGMVMVFMVLLREGRSHERGASRGLGELGEAGELGVGQRELGRSHRVLDAGGSRGAGNGNDDGCEREL